MRKVRSKLTHLFRKSPVSIVAIGIVIIGCPLALLHFTSRSNDGFLNDALPRVLRSGAKNVIASESSSWVKNPLFQPPVLKAPVEILDRAQHQVSCAVVSRNPNNPDFDLGNLTLTLTDLKFDGDAGIWDPEMEAKYLLKPRRNNASRPLQVFVVPFSHADPGWLSTVEEYFLTSTKLALDNMLKRLMQWPDMTFIWAETSYFKMWWETINAKQKSDVRSLITKGQLEIVNGGYVMPDEANCHYYAILHQYVYGHQWLLENLGVVPEHGFSIDPFGHSSSMPYFLKNLDFKTMFIQRIHYNLRKHLARRNASEFMWEQPWDEHDTNSMFCHLAPHHLYTIKNICALQPQSCYFYDFKDIMFEVEKTQLEGQSRQLLEGLRKTASIYPHNVVLYILGDDFRWAEETEWQNQYVNYKRIMQELNGNPANNVVMKFGTLKDYYNAVFERTGPPELPAAHFPKVQGDFFPYADKYEDYWTGYYTSRPFYKQMSRELERDLRTAEMLLILARAEKRGKASEYHEDLVGLERAAVNLGLFQHHDAITGTSKRAVALDYGDKLQNGLLMAHAVILKNVFRLAQIVSKVSVNESNIILENYRPTAVALPVKSPLHFTEGNSDRRLFIFNPLMRSRDTVIHLLVETQNLEIIDAKGQKLPYQVSPALNDLDSLGQLLDVVRISFFIRLDPLALKSITIKSVGSRAQKIKIAERFSTVIRCNEPMKLPGFKVQVLSEDEPIVLMNQFLRATFAGDTGMLQSIMTMEGKTHKVEMEFKRYETQSSGAYLFRPSGVGDLPPYPRMIRVLEGPLFTELQVVASRTFVQIVRIYNTSTETGKFLDMETITELNAYGNSEFILRFSTNIKNNKTFFTDSNGFQIVKRKVSHILPLAANYYPVTSMGFLQDHQTRLSLHLTQAHGLGSQTNGEIEIMLDRFLMQDDGRGVGEALQDLRAVKTLFRLQVEAEGFCTKDCPYNNPTDVATRVNMDINYPPYMTFEQVKSNISAFDYKPVKQAIPCDVHLVMMKPVTYDKEDLRVGFMFHRVGMDCTSSRTSSDICSPGEEVLLNSMFQNMQFKSYNETGLNFATARKRYAAKRPVKVENMSLAAIIATLPLN